ncbi:MAG: DUF2752 domain-containing protein [Treponema sp.]|jgi:hypothetical protein|nr:DUF2752 domain-containing protein [Treponema sp.]
MAMLLKKNNMEKMPLLDKIRALKNKDQILKTFLVLTALFIFYNIPTKYLGDTYPICLYRIIFKTKCFGCGTTRAIWSILHFNLIDALSYNKLVVIIFPLYVGCIISWIKKHKK